MWEYLNTGWDYAKKASSWLSYSPVKAVVKELPGGELGEYVIDLLQATTETEDQYNDYLANPNFIHNQIDGDSPLTLGYFAAQKMNTVGGFLSGTTIKAARGLGAWAGLERYNAWAKAAPKGGSLDAFLTTIIEMKRLQVASGTASTLTTVGGLQLWNLPLAIGSKVAGVITDLVADRLMQTYSPTIQVCATALHWRAYRELVVGRGVGIGPAVRILRTMFQEHNLFVERVGGFAKMYGGRVGTLGQGIVDLSRAVSPEKMADAYIVEPKGWLVFADLIKQL